MVSDMVQRIARAMCLNRGIDPDREVCSAPPEYVRHGLGAQAFFVPHEHYRIAAWKYFVGDVQVMLKEVHEHLFGVADLGGDVSLDKISELLS